MHMAVVQRVESSNPKSEKVLFCQPSSKWVPFWNFEILKAWK